MIFIFFYKIFFMATNERYTREYTPPMSREWRIPVWRCWQFGCRQIRKKVLGKTLRVTFPFFPSPINRWSIALIQSSNNRVGAAAPKTLLKLLLNSTAYKSKAWYTNFNHYVQLHSKPGISSKSICKSLLPESPIPGILKGEPRGIQNCNKRSF